MMMMMMMMKACHGANSNILVDIPCFTVVSPTLISQDLLSGTIHGHVLTSHRAFPACVFSTFMLMCKIVNDPAPLVPHYSENSAIPENSCIRSVGSNADLTS